MSKIPSIVGTFEPGIASREGGHVYKDVSGTLRADPGDNRMAVYGSDHYNQEVFKDIEPTLGVNCGTSTGRNGVVFYMKKTMNDEELTLGFDWHHSNMGVNYELEPTLHPLGTGAVMHIANKCENEKDTHE